jgi:osmotically-inducible protein OsmY
MMFYFSLVTLTFSLLLTGCQRDNGEADYDAAVAAHLRTVQQYANKSSVPVEKKTTRSYRYDNQKLSHEVLAALLSQDALKTAHLQVAGYHGDLLILGEVRDEASIQLALNIASSFENVKNLRTDLTIGKNIDARQRAADSAVNTQVKSEISNLGVPHSHLHILTNNNKVYIIGPVSKRDQLVIEQNLLALTTVNQVYFYYQ